MYCDSARHCRGDRAAEAEALVIRMWGAHQDRATTRHRADVAERCGAQRGQHGGGADHGRGRSMKCAAASSSTVSIAGWRR